MLLIIQQWLCERVFDYGNAVWSNSSSSGVNKITKYMYISSTSLKPIKACLPAGTSNISLNMSLGGQSIIPWEMSAFRTLIKHILDKLT